MKRFLLGLALALCSLSSLFAGSIDYLSNQSADYVRTFSRNHAIDAADAAFYNPAGTAFLQEGLSVQASNQTFFKDYSNTLNTTGQSYKSDDPTYFLPSFYAVYVRGSFAGYVGMNVIGGGGTVKYSDGIPMMVQDAPLILAAAKQQVPGLNGATFVSGNLTSSALYPSVLFGVAYSLNKNFSVSLGGRGTYATRCYSGSANYNLSGPGFSLSKSMELDAEETAFGGAAIIGMDIRPFDDLNIGIRFETPTILDLKTKVSNGEDFGGLFVDGKTRRKDLPAVLAAGIHYTLAGLTFSSSIDTYLIRFSDESKDDPSEGIYNSGYAQKYDPIGYEVSFSVEYAVIPDRLKVSAGYMYDKVGGNSCTYNDLDNSLDSNTFGAGVKIGILKNLDMTLAAARAIYINGSNQDKSVTYKKAVWVLSAGVDYRFN
jgi:long-chain fatty acid transport protein